MARYILARVLALIPTLGLLIFFVVMLVRLLPGDAIDIIMEEQVLAKEDREVLEKRLGLDKSVPEEWISFTVGVFTSADLGNSIWSQRPVRDVIAEKLPVTLKLGLMALAVSSTVGMMVGILAAVKQDTIVDYLLRSLSIASLSIPSFATATLVIVLPVIWFGWSPSVIYKPQDEGFVAHYTQFIIPAIILGMVLSSTLMRMTRTMMLEVMRQDYIRTARAKGVNERVVIFRHAFRNALIPVISLLGLQVANLVGGTVIIETVFGLPGVGRLLISSLSIRDYPMVQGITVMFGMSVIIVNLLVDLSYGWLDPRARIAG